MDTTFLKFDIGIQAFLIGLNILCIVLACVVEPGYLLCILYLQMIAGLVQLASSGIHLAQKRSKGVAKWRKIHFWGSLVFLLIFFDGHGFNQGGAILLTLFFVFPQCIFYAYFFMSIRELRLSQNQES